MVDLDLFVAKLQNLHIVVLDYSCCKICKLLLDIPLKVQIHGKVYIELFHLLDFSSYKECWVKTLNVGATKSLYRVLDPGISVACRP